MMTSQWLSGNDSEIASVISEHKKPPHREWWPLMSDTAVLLMDSQWMSDMAPGLATKNGPAPSGED